MEIANGWKDYEILDMADGMKLERWENIILERPDPQIIWKDKQNSNLWKESYAKYIRSATGGGHWETKKKIPASWQVRYRDLVFNIKPMGFKHTGLFPEQAVNWDFMMNKIEEEKKHRKEPIKVLNLFAYTGGASVACLKAGAEVTHIDSSKGMIAWAKENVASSGLQDRKIRFLIDDCIKFVQREIRRGNKYDAIIMDPPSYGRGANGEVWKFEENIEELIKLCMQILEDRPLFFLVNSYTTGISSKVIENILKINMKNKVKGGRYSNGEIGLPMKNSDLVLPCGIYARWEK